MEQCTTICGKIKKLAIESDQCKGLSIEVGMNTDYENSTVSQEVETIRAKNLDSFIDALKAAYESQDYICIAYDTSEEKITSLNVVERPKESTSVVFSGGTGRPRIYGP